MTPAIFLTYFPEFQEAPAPIIQAKLLLAAARMGGPDFTVWGQPAALAATGQPPNPPTIVDQAQMALAAHMIMTAPTGASTLLVTGKDGSTSTVYLEQFLELEQSVCGGFVVAGAIV